MQRKLILGYWLGDEQAWMRVLKQTHRNADFVPPGYVYADDMFVIFDDADVPERWKLTSRGSPACYEDDYTLCLRGSAMGMDDELMFDRYKRNIDKIARVVVAYNQVESKNKIEEEDCMIRFKSKKALEDFDTGDL